MATVTSYAVNKSERDRIIRDLDSPEIFNRGPYDQAPLDTLTVDKPLGRTIVYILDGKPDLLDYAVILRAQSLRIPVVVFCPFPVLVGTATLLGESLPAHTVSEDPIESFTARGPERRILVLGPRNIYGKFEGPQTTVLGDLSADLLELNEFDLLLDSRTKEVTAYYAPSAGTAGGPDQIILAPVPQEELPYRSTRAREVIYFAPSQLPRINSEPLALPKYAAQFARLIELGFTPDLVAPVFGDIASILNETLIAVGAGPSTPLGQFVGRTGISLYNSVFLYYWTRQYGERFRFPGIVIASLLEVAPKVTGGETTLHRWLELWSEYVRDHYDASLGPTDDTWCIERGIDAREWTGVITITKRLVSWLGVGLAGPFTVEGAIDRVRVILARSHQKYLVTDPASTRNYPELDNYLTVYVVVVNTISPSIVIVLPGDRMIGLPPITEEEIEEIQNSREPEAPTLASIPISR